MDKIDAILFWISIINMLSIGYIIVKLRNIQIDITILWLQINTLVKTVAEKLGNLENNSYIHRDKDN
ncbi:hypothetical protein OAA15_00385 [bacterium]|nr:hypothetical protein [bacterium]